MRNYIGLASSTHDPALAIVNSAGEIVFAEATERYLQNKRAWGSPPDDINRILRLVRRYCEPGAELVYARPWLARLDPTFVDLLGGANRILEHLEQVSAGGAPIKESAKPYLNSIGFDLTDLDNIGTRALMNAVRFGINSLTTSVFAGSSLRYRLGESYESTPIVTERVYNHHLAHAAAACYTSPFSEAVCAVMDGNGDMGETNSFFKYKYGCLTRIESPKGATGSLGGFYSALCTACGFDPIAGEEWKVMGLASYGRWDERIDSIIRPMLEHRPLGLRFAENYTSHLTRLLELRRPPGSDPRLAANLACTGQEIFCEYANRLLDDLYALGLSENVVLSGGCGLNSSWNGRILSQTRFERLHVYCAPADDGNAVGAALLAYYEDHPPKSAPAKEGTPYLGELMSKETIEQATSLGGLRSALPPGKSVPEFTAELLAAGKIVGWAQGRAEFGPRALGNRSILADPRDPEMKDRINARVKFREEYRPFAPSILHEQGPNYFEHYQEAPYMERTLKFRAEMMAKVPAVVHVDGTGRLQTVRREWNPRYHDLIQAFYRLTGVPIILNTSFNIMGKPIIHSVEDALSVFYTTGLDALVIEDVILLKSN